MLCRVSPFLPSRPYFKLKNIFKNLAALCTLHFWWCLSQNNYSLSLGFVGLHQRWKHSEKKCFAEFLLFYPHDFTLNWKLFSKKPLQHCAHCISDGAWAKKILLFLPSLNTQSYIRRPLLDPYVVHSNLIKEISFNFLVQTLQYFFQKKFRYFFAQENMKSCS